ncbi:lipocalin family protein [Allohahella marinimesophila]|uniref:Outer membrane lipoprotein Blc n=1 Tax=Allohahella marinimesophila TaxID=1054972 RepID=A0ABP7P9L8_9GAMM
MPSIDVPRFMGEWYVIAHIPTFIEDESHNAIEAYTLNEDGSVAVDFTFNDKSLDGPLKEYELTAFINEELNSKWQVQPFWPIKADYRIVYLDEAYEQTVIARPSRDYVWIMARSPAIPEADYDKMVKYIDSIGYDTRDIRRVPHGK